MDLGKSSPYSVHFLEECPGPASEWALAHLVRTRSTFSKKVYEKKDENKEWVNKDDFY